MSDDVNEALNVTESSRKVYTSSPSRRALFLQFLLSYLLALLSTIILIGISRPGGWNTFFFFSFFPAGLFALFG